MDDDQPSTVLIHQEISDDDTSNQQPQDMPETSNQAVLPDSPEQFNHPCGDLLDGGRRRDYNDICVPLFQASVVGDWEAAEKILSINGEFRVDLLGYAITEDKDTALNVAVFSKSIKFVENLVNRMTDEQLVLQDKDGRTALFNVAGAGNVEMARVMVDRCPQLLKIRASYSRPPIHNAVLYGKRNMFAYLYGKYKSMGGNDWTYQDIHVVFWQCMEGDLFDSALKILEDQNNPIGFRLRWYAREVLYILARKTNAFKDVKSWKNSSVDKTITMI
ncbi:hypothetical protein OSB04_014022 [Centaurea solstitialis]|uniref:Uncharacterized protein n=1 Tax=Centaurea solstitialis TaxID=347529 RepID=A0AA38TEC0_9ASTR|nr:hypothetical protein OSB04_014022 [Centaurea solstitialis]